MVLRCTLYLREMTPIALRQQFVCFYVFSIDHHYRNIHWQEFCHKMPYLPIFDSLTQGILRNFKLFNGVFDDKVVIHSCDLPFFYTHALHIFLRVPDYAMLACDNYPLLSNYSHIA